MTLVIDFDNKTVILQGASIELVSKLDSIIRSAGHDPKEFEVQSVFYEPDTTSDVDVNYLTKKDIN